MPEPHFATLDDDDLPRTLRRARAEKQARERAAEGPRFPASLKAAMAEAARASEPARLELVSTSAPLAREVTVTRLAVPFSHLVLFFMKAVFAALPALFLLTALLWTFGEVIQRTYPWLLKMRILIQFPT